MSNQYQEAVTKLVVMGMFVFFLLAGVVIILAEKLAGV